jgi:hypothetical protein
MSPLTHIQEVVGSIPTAPTILEVRGRKSEAGSRKPEVGEKNIFCIVLATIWPFFILCPKGSVYRVKIKIDSGEERESLIIVEIII